MVYFTYLLPEIRLHSFILHFLHLLQKAWSVNNIRMPFTLTTFSKKYLYLLPSMLFFSKIKIYFYILCVLVSKGLTKVSSVNELLTNRLSQASPRLSFTVTISQQLPLLQPPRTDFTTSPTASQLVDYHHIKCRLLNASTRARHAFWLQARLIYYAIHNGIWNLL